MTDKKEKILVWLPSPMGDAVLCTPALRALRKGFADSQITFLASATVRSILSPCDYTDDWIDAKGGPIKLAKELRRHGFAKAILFKNSFGSALTVALAGITERIGYSRDMRGILLTKGIQPARDAEGRFKAGSMIDYYLRLCSETGCDIIDRSMELQLSERDESRVAEKIPALSEAAGPVIILVPGGAFGPSKCWPAQRYAQLADRLIEQHNATVVISVAPNEPEQKIAREITDSAARQLISLAEVSLSLGELKGLIAKADLVITNDTGPRHIAIALKRKLITLFGPNNPQWTQTGYAAETQIVGKAPCVPCDKPVCKQPTHECMNSITVDRAYAEAEKFLS